jgi:serine/threonine protein kinase
VIQDVVSALAHLHANGIVHADVKPANILVGIDERGKLADFDISVDSGIVSDLHAVAPVNYPAG